MAWPVWDPSDPELGMSSPWIEWTGSEFGLAVTRLGEALSFTLVGPCQ